MVTDIAQKILRGTETILVMDDEQMVRDVTKPMLEKLGYSVHLVEKSEAAVRAYEEYGETIDLVILDLMMPGMNGGQVYDKLKAINPDVKVLLSSGYGVAGDATEILSRGCNGFIQKPFGLIELSHKVRAILDE